MAAVRDLNLQRRRWMELLKDYNCSILYHPGKANAVADALSRKSRGRLEDTCIKFSVENSKALLACAQAKSSLVEHIKATQYEDERLCKYRDDALAGKSNDMIVGSDSVLRMGGRLYVAHVKAEHQRPVGLLQQIEIPEWKWVRITKDFVTGLLQNLRGYDSVWVLVDRLKKSTYFLSVKTTYGGVRYAQIFMNEIV
ncbi:uncharacterized protein LOC142181858 [Nicotiana tabacum]|uniref:Uncharacterized protein LOC142181858 n=1 Tax=Nicotiana tabacum TaxID=4097 RepID=A0AC58UPZ8_TOBAC